MPVRLGLLESVAATFCEQIELSEFLLGTNLVCLRWQRQFVAESLRQTLRGFRGEAFKVIAGESPGVADFAKVSLDFQGPTFQGRFAFPKEFVVAMNELAGAIVLGRVIAKQSQVKKVGRARKEFEWRKIAFVQRTRIGPSPANAAILEQPNNLRPVPAGISKLNRETKIFRKLDKKFPQRLPTIFRRERRRKLNQNNLQFRFEGFDGAQKCVELRCAIAQTTDVCDLARELATETKRRRRLLHPAPDRVLRWSGIEG